MSKQPRGNVRVGAGNSVGARVSNVFIDVKKFQKRFVDAMDKAATNNSKERDISRDARMSAIQAIQSISKWLYWKSPVAGEPMSESRQNLTCLARKSAEQDIKKLRDAADARKQAREGLKTFSRQSSPSGYLHRDEYWIPSRQALPSSIRNLNSSNKTASKPFLNNENKATDDQVYNVSDRERRDSTEWWGIPMATATIAAVLVRLQAGDRVVSEIKEHVGGSLALAIVNSSWLQVVLAGFTWYLIGVAMVELVHSIRNR